MASGSHYHQGHPQSWSSHPEQTTNNKNQISPQCNNATIIGNGLRPLKAPLTRNQSLGAEASNMTIAENRIDWDAWNQRRGVSSISPCSFLRINSS